jgi:hypothetical protein
MAAQQPQQDPNATSHARFLLMEEGPMQPATRGDPNDSIAIDSDDKGGTHDTIMMTVL